MRLFSLRNPGTRARRFRAGIGLGRIEILESRQLLSFASPFASPTTPGSFGLSKTNTVDQPALPGDSTVHNFYAVLDNDAGVSTATINGSGYTAGSATVDASISGNVKGPSGFAFGFHGKRIDFYVGGNLVPLASIGETISQGPTDATGRQSADFSATIPLPVSQSTDSVNMVITDTDQNYSTPQIHIFDINVDVVRPTVTSVGQVTPQTRTTPVSSVPVVFSEAILPSTFTAAGNVILTRDGTRVNLAGTSVAVNGSSANYTIDNLDSVTTAPGNYQLSVDANGIQDLVKNQGNTVSSPPISFLVGSVPAITSNTTTSFLTGVPSTFTVTTSGFPAPQLSASGTDKLPPNVSFDPATGVLGGIPAAGTGGTYNLSFTASNALGTSTRQDFTLTVGQAPAITSNISTLFSERTGSSFTVTTTGFPAPTLSISGTRPASVTFNPATGVLSNSPAVGSAGTYPLTITASNGIGPDVTQSFTLNIVSTDISPTINSQPVATFTAGEAKQFTVTAAGSPIPTLTRSGTLPAGVSFTDSGNATGVLGGTPAAGTGGTYNLTFNASNGVGSPSVQNFTLTVNQGPAITSGNAATFTTGQAGTITVAAGGFPTPTLSEVGALPSGVTFNPATGALAGTPATGTAGTYRLTFNASNGVGTAATQAFTLTVNQGTGFTSPVSTTFIAGKAGTFAVTAGGSPAPTLTESGTLPAGITFDPATGLLAGTPAPGTGGTYPLTFTAANGIGAPTSQGFTLTVDQGAAINGINAATFVVGSAGTFRVTASGFPAAKVTESGLLPAGVTFDPATGILGGTPLAQSVGTYHVTFAASNGIGDAATQGFTLTIERRPSSGPEILAIRPVDSPRKTPVSTVTVDLSADISPSSFSESNLKLTRDGQQVSLVGSPVTEVPLPGSSKSFLINGLAGLTSTPGAYVLTIVADNLRDLDGNGGIGSRSISFVVAPTTPPTIVDVAGGRRIHVQLDRPLDMARANDPANYTLLPVLDGRRNKGRSPSVIAAAYDASTQIIELSTSRRLMPNRSYLLVIHGTAPGGLADTSGTSLGGDSTLVVAGKSTRRPHGQATHAAVRIFPAAIDALFASHRGLHATRSKPHHR